MCHLESLPGTVGSLKEAIRDKKEDERTVAGLSSNGCQRASG